MCGNDVVDWRNVQREQQWTKNAALWNARQARKGCRTRQTYWVLSIKNESSHSRATPSIPKSTFKRSARTSKLMVSNAAEMSSASKTVTRWLSMFRTTSLKTRSSAVRLNGPLYRLIETHWNSRMTAHVAVDDWAPAFPAASTECLGWWWADSWPWQSCPDHASSAVELCGHVSTLMEKRPCWKTY